LNKTETINIKEENIYKREHTRERENGGGNGARIGDRGSPERSYQRGPKPECPSEGDPKGLGGREREMKRAIKFEIECGETTCASKPSHFCRFFKGDLRGDGQCSLFGKVFNENGRIQRHQDCIQIAVGEGKGEK